MLLELPIVLPLLSLSTQVSMCSSIPMCTHMCTHTLVLIHSTTAHGESGSSCDVWYDLKLYLDQSLCPKMKKAALYLTLAASFFWFMVGFPYMFCWEQRNYHLILGMRGHRWGTWRVGAGRYQRDKWAPKSNLTHVPVFLRISPVHTAVSGF